MSAMKRIWKAVGCLLGLVMVAAGIAAGYVAFQFWLFIRLPGNATRTVQQVTIQPGMSALSIAGLLREAGVITDPRKFYLLCRLRRSGQKLQAGEYAFSTLSTPVQVLEQLTEGRVVLHRVTLPEGSDLRDVALILENAGLVSRANILQLAQDRDYIKGLGLQGSSLEGYLFPETYYFSRTQNDRSILKTMVRQFWFHFPESWQKRAEAQGFSIHQVVIMASMVEKEAVVDSERSLIAAVFLNRLKRNMPLQSDPTAVYDLPDFSGPITREHLQRRSPYNTYQKKGLPVGPICNPGAKSLEAVLYPENTPYLYFVSNNDGTHRFSESLTEHLRAVSNYRKLIRISSEKSEPAPRCGQASHGIGILERKQDERAARRDP